MDMIHSEINKIKRFSISDFILIGIIIFITFMMLFIKKDDADKINVSVRLDGQEIHTQALYEIDNAYEYKIDSDMDVILLLEKDGVSVKHSDCPDKLCVNMGKITKSGECIVCLPAKVSVKLYSDDNNSKLDGVTR